MKTDPSSCHEFPPVPGSNDGSIPGLKGRAAAFFRGRETLLWWMHSAYALLFGLAVLWLGSRNFLYLQLVFFHITFIWLSSLFLSAIVNRPWLSPEWRERVRLAINYFNKNFYQQLLFFLLPVYYASMTFGSRNMLFPALLAISATLSTMDIVYDRYLSVRWHWTALFFMFNLFAAINVILPVLWAVSNRTALWISGALALGSFVTMWYRLSGLRGRPAKVLLAAAVVGMLLILEVLPPFIPPAPLRMANAGFGRFVRELQIVSPLDRIPSGPCRIAVLTAIQAPLGMEEEVRHRWILDGKVIFVSSLHQVAGGRRAGYRLWTQITWQEGMRGETLMVDVETASGQLIGRAMLKGRVKSYE